MDFPKKQAQRLMPLYLLEYNEKLFENHPNPEAPWGGGGGDYTAGYGIDITNSEISVDTTVIATKSDIAQMVTTTQLEDALDDYALKTDIPENVSDLNNDAGYTTQTWVENQGYSKFSGDYNDLSNKPTIPTVNDPTITFTQGGVTKGSITLNQSSNQTIALDAGSSSVDWQDITNKPDLLPIIDMSEAFTFTATGNHYPPYKWGENMACTSTWLCYGSVEALPQIYLSNWFSTPYEFIAYPQYIWQDQNGYHAVYSTEFTENDFVASGARIVLNAPSLGVTWTSVSTIPVYGFDSVNNATITFTQGGVNKGSFTVNQWQDQTIALDAAGSSYSAGTGIDITNNEISIDNTVALKSEIPTATSDLTNDSGFITGITSSDITTALGYTPGTSNFSGNYNDLTNKPTIPDAVSGTNDGTNWTSLTVGNDTYAIPQGGSAPGMIGEVLYDVPNGEAGVNPITMAHSFADYSYVDIQYRNYDNAYEVKCVRVYDPNGKHVYLDWDVLISGTVYAKKSTYILNGNTMTVKDGTDMQVWYSNGSKVGTQATATTDYQHQIKITKVIGYKANNSALTTEEWTFTLQDGTTTTKKIMLG